MGVLCLYMLIGMLFGFVYGALDRFGGDPFFADGSLATVSRCLYFSFATLTTVGYGDLVARTDTGHTLAVFEALLGQIYLVTVVSLIVSNLGRRARTRDDRPA
jgi:voltage-gated potassium channel Kch